MSIPATYDAEFLKRHRSAIAVVAIALAVARSAPLPEAEAVKNVVTLKSWRERRKAKREEWRRIEKETPLYVHRTDHSSPADGQEYSCAGEEDGRLGKQPYLGSNP